jgi:formylmethanofuran dehydrogenase subunit D
MLVNVRRAFGPMLVHDKDTPTAVTLAIEQKPWEPEAFSNVLVEGEHRTRSTKAPNFKDIGSDAVCHAIMSCQRSTFVAQESRNASGPI